MAGYLRADGWLRLMVAAQFLFGTAAATFPFFVLFAREIIPGGTQMIGVFLVMQNLGGVAAALICGQLIDRVGSWASIRLVALAQVVALLAVLLASVGVPQIFVLGAFLMLGFVGGSSWWSFNAYLLDMATEDQRPIYLATSGILTSPTFLSSILVGVLFEVARPEVVFLSALALSGAGLALAWRIPRARGQRMGCEEPTAAG